MIKVLQFGTLDVAEGGPALSTYLTMKGIDTCGGSSTIIMPPPLRSGRVVSESVNRIYTASPKLKKFEYIPHLKESIESVGRVDIFHIQGLWRYIGAGAANYARRRYIPYVISLRGMLYPQALAASALVKKLSLWLFQRRDLQCAACIQATCMEEMEHYRNLGFTNPVAVIPNPIDLDDSIGMPIPQKPYFKVGYLGRVHPRKRIERLIYAMSYLQEKINNVELVIIGSGDEGYESFLRNEVKRLKLKNVTFTGFLTGEEKKLAINELSVLAVPSDFENFGNIVTEALVRGVPVIASTGMPWQELETYQCGWWINNDQDSINKTILKAYGIGEAERIQMGMNGKRLMKENYSVEILGGKMMRLYEWILGRANKPDFVYED